MIKKKQFVYTTQRYTFVCQSYPKPISFKQNVSSKMYFLKKTKKKPILCKNTEDTTNKKSYIISVSSILHREVSNFTK